MLIAELKRYNISIADIEFCKRVQNTNENFDKARYENKIMKIIDFRRDMLSKGSVFPEIEELFLFSIKGPAKKNGDTTGRLILQRTNARLGEIR